MKISKIFSRFLIAFGFLSIFMAAKPFHENPKPNPTILRTIGAMLEQGHYSPKKIDDALSKEIFSEFIKRLDPNKRLFLQKDLHKLRKFENSIDDEIHGSALIFFDETNAIFTQRLQESKEIYENIIEKPFEFSKDETFEADSDKFDFANNENNRKERWRKYLKWMTLERFIELQEQQKKTKQKATLLPNLTKYLKKKPVQKLKKRWTSILKECK